MLAMFGKIVQKNHGSIGRAGGKLDSQSGQSLLEMALLTPLLLAMVLGSIELGRYAYLSILVGNAAHAGALYGAQSTGQAAPPPPTTPLTANGSMNGGITVAAQNDFQNNGGQSAQNLIVTWTNSCACDNQGTLTSEVCTTGASATAGICPAGQNWVVMVAVTAKATFDSLFKYPWIPSPITVSRTSTMRVANY
ncbi:MAG: pilus assembly protein [Acidobacteriota bacterium]|nr:pilus assembly protein [Acidobacteriota bacterium]